MTRYLASVAILIIASYSIGSTSALAIQPRRAFLSAAAPVALVFWHDGTSSCQCVSCANAYEVRTVGGENASPSTKAMNLQMVDTNNRLERDGLKMEVRLWHVVSFATSVCFSQKSHLTVNCSNLTRRKRSSQLL